MRASIQCNLRRRAICLPSPSLLCKALAEIETASRLATPSSQCSAAAGDVLGNPLLHSLRISDHQLEHGGVRAATLFARRGQGVHPRLLARAAVDDPNGM